MDSRIEIFKGDITILDVDAIVNAANRSLLGGGGVDGAIHRAAGPALLQECKILGGCDTGDAKITKGYNLKANYVIHTVGPVWHGGSSNEDNLLSNCYFRCLELAVQNNIKTVAFPAISTGVYAFPLERAAKIAFTIITKFLENNSSIGKVIFVCFSQNDYEVYIKVAKEFS